MGRPRALLVNPYIYDFAAYSFWSSPLGLLYIGGILVKNGFRTELIDCMRVREDKRKPDGRAPFVKEKVLRPEKLKGTEKTMRRYGISPKAFREELARIERPDLVFITSIMTYWYPGVKEVVDIVREIFESSKIIVGGIHPTLCYEEATRVFKSADLVVRAKDVALLYRFVEESCSSTLSFKPPLDDLNALPYPVYNLCREIPFVPLLTSFGCPFRCTYCASPFMYPRIVRRSVECVLKEICHWRESGVERFVIYDDSFLYQSRIYAKPLLRKIGLAFPPASFYNPNAVNASFIDDELAELLMGAGFKEVRIGLESIDPRRQKDTGGKVTNATFEQAVRSLNKAGYGEQQISAYVLAGLPGQCWQEVKEALDYLRYHQVTPHIAGYAPTPHTTMFDRFHKLARFPVADDSIYQNNALFPFAWEGFTEKDLEMLKRYAKGDADQD